MVLACGMCGDMQFRADAWWATAVGWPFLALLFSVLASTSFAKLAFGLLTTGAAFAVLVLSFFVVGIHLGLWIASGLLLLALIISLVIHKLPRWFDVARVGLVVAAMIFGLVKAQPWSRRTADILDVALYVKKFPPHPSWIYGELLSRAETRELLEAKLMVGKEGSSHAVELHRELGYPAEVRRDACHALKVKDREKACPGE